MVTVAFGFKLAEAVAPTLEAPCAPCWPLAAVLSKVPALLVLPAVPEPPVPEPPVVVPDVLPDCSYVLEEPVLPEVPLLLLLGGLLGESAPALEPELPVLLSVPGTVVPLPVELPDMPLEVSPVPPRIDVQADRPSAMASKPAKATLWCFCFMINSL